MINYTDLPFYWINRLSFLSRRQLAQRFESAGHKISPEEWALLLVLWSKGAQAPSALSDETIKDRTTVTRLVDGLVRKGFVQRRENPEDRRRSDITLTERGTELRDELVPHAMRLIAGATAGVSEDDLKTTIRTLKALADNMTSTDVN